MDQELYILLCITARPYEQQARSRLTYPLAFGVGGDGGPFGARSPREALLIALNLCLNKVYRYGKLPGADPTDTDADAVFAELMDLVYMIIDKNIDIFTEADSDLMNINAHYDYNFWNVLRRYCNLLLDRIGRRRVAEEVTLDDVLVPLDL